MKEEFVCSFCGKELTEDTAHEFSGRVMCSHCFELRTAICNHCGKVMWKDRAYGDNNILICETCFENDYSTCEDCGRLLHNDDGYYFDESDYPYYRQCYDKINLYAIKSYNYKPEPIFYDSGDLFIGVELEIDKGGESNENAKVLLDIANQIAMLYDEYQILFAVHLNTANTHIHFVINTVNVADGHKFSQSRAQLRALKQSIDEIIRKFGLIPDNVSIDEEAYDWDCEYEEEEDEEPEWIEPMIFYEEIGLIEPMIWE